jgi:hypothetical protein
MKQTQLVLFKPRSGLEDAYLKSVETFRQWAVDGRITWKQFQDFRREAEYNIILRNRRQERDYEKTS